MTYLSTSEIQLWQIIFFYVGMFAMWLGIATMIFVAVKREMDRKKHG